MEVARTRGQRVVCFACLVVNQSVEAVQAMSSHWGVELIYGPKKEI